MRHQPEFAGPYYDPFGGEFINAFAGLDGTPLDEPRIPKRTKTTIQTMIQFEDGRVAYITTALDGEELTVSVQGLRHVTKVKADRW